VKGQANLGRLLFSFDLVMLAVAAGAEENVEIGSIDFQRCGGKPERLLRRLFPTSSLCAVHVR
jgi:hypothetical protein